jgi:hypothetical protein
VVLLQFSWRRGCKGGRGDWFFLFLIYNIHFDYLDLIEKGGLGTIKKDITEIERMLKVLIKFLENKPLNPWTLFSNQIGEEPFFLKLNGIGFTS